MRTKVNGLEKSILTLYASSLYYKEPTQVPRIYVILNINSKTTHQRYNKTIPSPATHNHNELLSTLDATPIFEEVSVGEVDAPLFIVVFIVD
jgi:hypothetical protein